MTVVSRRWVSASAVWMLLLAAAPAQLSEPGPAIGSEHEALLERIVRRAAGPKFFGAVLVMRDGRALLRKGFGVDPRTGRAIGPDTLFDGASVSKQFTAAAVLKLASQRKLSTFDPVERWLPVPADKKAIRIHHLLNHTSGLALEVGLSEAERRDRDAMLARVMREPLQSPPGDMFAYNNVGYAVLAALVEVVARQPFESWVRKHVLGPAGMVDTGFLDDSGLDPARAASRREERADRDFADTAVAWPWHWAFKGATGVVTTVDDLYRWDRALGAGRVLPPAELAQLFRPTTHDYAYGLVVVRTARRTTRIGHGGRTYGYKTSFARFPDEDAVVIALANPDCDMHALAGGLEEALFALPPDRSTLESCVGSYRLPSGGLVEIVSKERELWLRAVGNDAARRVLHGKVGPAGDRFCREDFAKRARHLMRDIAAGRKRKLAREVSPEAGAGAVDAITARWEGLRRRHGMSRSVTLLGSSAAQQRSFFRCKFARQTVRFALAWDEEQRIVDAAVHEGPSPFEVRLAWRRGREFAGRSLQGWEDLYLVFGGDGGRPAPTLRYADRSAPRDEPLVLNRRR